MAQNYPENQKPSTAVAGFILTRQLQESNDGLKYVLWLATSKGPVKVTQNRQEAVFFVEASSLKQARNALVGYRYREKALELSSFNQQQVSGFYFLSYRELRQAASTLEKHRIVPLEFDIRPVDRYLMERFITGPVWAELPHESTNAAEDIRLRPVKFDSTGIEPLTTNYYQTPRLKVVSFDIETSMVGDHLYCIAVHRTMVGSVDGVADNDSQSRVFMLASADAENGLPGVENYSSERGLITAFLQWIQQDDPDILIGWNCINFDLRFLERKCQALHMPFNIGRDGEPAQWRTSASSPQQHFVLIPGRAVLDGIDTLKMATYQFESFSLENVSRALLNRGKLIHDPDDRGEEITRLFNEDKQSLAKYNLEDCVLVWEIFEKVQLIQFALQRAKLTGLALDKVGGSVAAFENLYLPKLHRQGYVAPNLPKNPQGVGSPGGYVMDSLPGFYESVLVFDFKSLYPSIIRTFRVDPFGLVEGDKWRNASKESLDKFTQNDVVEGFRGATFRISQSILPGLIEDLWVARDIAKKEKNQPLSQALKIIMNSFYGVMGTPGCRFFDFRLPSSITLRGHEILTQTRTLFEAEGYKVIYGDTDSIFVLAKSPLAESTATHVGSLLAAKLNRWWQQHILQKYGIGSALELEYETHYARFVMPRIRGSMEGTKKRYAGLICQQGFDANAPVPGSYELVFKGLETVRTDWTKAARQFQRALYERIFLGQPWKEYVLDTIESLRRGELDQQLVFRKRLRRRLAEYQKNVPPHAQAAIKAEIWLKENNKPSRYAQGGWIEYLYTVNGPEPVECLTSHIDYELYIERQIAPIVDGIACFLEESYCDLSSTQMSLL